MALYRGIAGDPGGVRKLASSLGAVCLTVMLCLKSSGNEICPGSRFKSYIIHTKEAFSCKEKMERRKIIQNELLFYNKTSYIGMGNGCGRNRVPSVWLFWIFRVALLVLAYFVSSSYSIHGLIIRFPLRPVLVHASAGSLPVDVVSIAFPSVHLLCNVIPVRENVPFIFIKNRMGIWVEYNGLSFKNTMES